MLGRMNSRQIRFFAVALLLALLGLAACGTGNTLVAQRANAFLGGTLSGFGGTDGGDPDARAVARDIASSRTYDFTPTGFDIVAGPASSTGAGGSLFTAGDGDIALSGDTATVTLDMLSNDPAVTDAQMVGTFSLAEATTAIASPGASFTVHWTLSFKLNSVDVSLTADQPLTGTDFVTV
jgi:hypothetical protein